jgi:branched-chain amino acid transport system substrate-binding protein
MITRSFPELAIRYKHVNTLVLYPRNSRTHSKQQIRKIADSIQLLNTYQARAREANVDLLGHYMAPLAYAQLQVLAQAVEATGGFDDARLAAYARSTAFDTVMGSITFGINGEWAEPRVLQVQFQGTSGHDVDQFRSGSRQIVVTPSNFASGKVRFPYALALSS